MNKKIEFGLRSSVYLSLFILLFFFFDCLKKLIIQNTSTPYWINILNLKGAVISFLILIVCFEIWFISHNKLKKFFLKKEYLIYLIIIIIFLITNIALQFSSPSSGDVRYTAHVGFLISQGEKPYLDFFEFHTPLYGYMMAFVFLLFGNMASIQILHILSFLALILSAWFVYKIGNLVFKYKRASFWMVILFISFKNILVSYDIRFDVFAALFTIIGFFYLIRAKNIKDYMYSGFFIAIGFLFVQKNLLHIIGIIAIIFIINIKDIKKQIIKLSYFILGLFIPWIIFYTTLYFYIGLEGLRRYYILNFLFINATEWNYNTFDKLVSYFITNGASLLCAVIGLFIFIVYYKKIKRYKLVLGVIILNFLIFIFLIVKGGRISPQDFMYFFPFLTIPAVAALIHISQKMNNNFKKYLYFPFLIWLLLVPFALTSFNIIVPKNTHEIVFYLENFKGEKTNCNFIFNPLHRYHIASNHWWIKEEGGAKDFLRKHKISFDDPSVKQMINNDYRIICIEHVKDPDAKEFLTNLGYVPYSFKGKLSNSIYYKY